LDVLDGFLERRDGINVGNILCDPIKAQEFDALAVRISPGYSPLQYRWAALNLRKLRRLRPEIIGKALPSKRVTVVSVREIDAAELPLGQGLYIFFTSSEALYVGEAKNLRNRVEKHLDHSDRKELARWMWEYGNERTMLEIHVLDEATTTQVRRALEAELIRSRRPLFNIQNG
jgi:predicted GIY-YIG superfamily endonuclease